MCHILTYITGIGVLTRIVVRFFIIRKQGWDDYAIVGAYVSNQNLPSAFLAKDDQADMYRLLG
jgi:hypothetical protein